MLLIDVHGLGGADVMRNALEYVVQVSEGLVQVSDPPLHNRGNFLDSQVELDRHLLDYIVGLDTEINELVDGSVSSVLSCFNRQSTYMYTYIGVFGCWVLVASMIVLSETCKLLLLSDLI